MKIGRLLNDRYEIESELGRGGMGIIYRARDTILERQVAVKVLSASALGTAGRARLLQEARTIASLNHPNIVAIYDVGETRLLSSGEITSFIIMELVDGHSLGSYRLKSLDELINIADQICIALEEAHASGIVHRDLKPENVILTTSQTAKLMDFGLAQSPDDEGTDRSGEISGTLFYMAPEVILGQVAGHRSDLYALGVMLYEFAAGQPPFDRDDLTTALSQRLYAPTVPPSTYNAAISPTLDMLILKLLGKQPEDRPSTAADVRRELAECRIAQKQWQPEAYEVDVLDRLVRGRLIGREPQLAQSNALWLKAIGGDGQVLLVSGEPGVGKTRLVRELITYAQLTGGQVLSAECYAEGTGLFMPFAQVVRSGLSADVTGLLPDSVVADLLLLAPDLRSTMPGIPAAEQAEPEVEQLRLSESVLALCRVLSGIRPLLLFVDDVHWADSGTQALLRHLARRLRQDRVMIVTTYREAELDHTNPFRQVLLDLQRERLATRIKLSRLDRVQTGDLLATLFASEISMDFQEAVFRETEGNPFFIEEVCKAMIAGGKLRFRGGQWHRASLDDLEIPQGVQAAIQSRLGKLSTKELELLYIAALLGREFQYDMLWAVCRIDRDWLEDERLEDERLEDALDEIELIDALDRFQRAQLITEVEITRAIPATKVQLSFTFTHGLIHSTLLASMSTLRRLRLQRRVALALQEAYPDRLDELAPLLGRYFAEAGDADRAIWYLVHAGGVSRRLFAYDEAIEYYQHALLFMREGGENEKAARALMNLGLLYHNTFRFEESRRAYDEGFALWQLAGGALVPSTQAKMAPQSHTSHLHQPITLDPARCADGVSEICIQHFFSGLVELSPGGEVLPEVAQSWEILEDGRRYVFHLREDALWSDGRPVTAHDFEFAWKRALAPTNGVTPATFLYDIKGAMAYNQGPGLGPEGVGVKASGERTLVVELDGPTGYFLQLLSRAVAMPVPRHAVEANGRRWSDPDLLIANGPFKPADWQTGKSMVWVRSETYRGRFGGNLEKVILVSDPDAPVLDMYESGELDVVRLDDLTLSEAAQIRQRHFDEYMTVPYMHSTYLAFDVTREPFHDRRVRRALAMALDKPRLANVSMKGRYFAATGGLVPPGMPGHVPELGLPYSPERARQLLAEAGYNDLDDFPEIEILAIRHPSDHDLHVDMQMLWSRNLGIKVKWKRLVFADFIESLAREAPLAWKSGWAADYPDPDSFLRVCPWRQTAGWQNERYEQLVDQARRRSGTAERMAMYREAEQILIEEAAIVPLFYSRTHVLLKPWVKHYPLAPVGVLLLKNVLIDPH